MTAATRQRAVDFLADRGEPVAGPVLAEALGVDPMELGFLLAYPLALNVIRTWRVGPMSMWAISSGLLPPVDKRTVGWQRVVRVLPAEDGQVEFATEED